MPRTTGLGAIAVQRKERGGGREADHVVLVRDSTSLGPLRRLPRPPTTVSMMRSLRSMLPARLRTRRSLESTVYVTTFIAALVTVSVSASTILPCPANGYGALKDRLHPANRGAMLEECEERESTPGYVPEQLPIRGLGQRAFLTKRDGWIEINERPSLFSWRRWTSS